jgi:hypothetical protein
MPCSMICQWAQVCLYTCNGDTGGRLVMHVLFPLYFRLCGVLCSRVQIFKVSLWFTFVYLLLLLKCLYLRTFNSKISTEVYLAWMNFTTDKVQRTHTFCSKDAYSPQVFNTCSLKDYNSNEQNRTEEEHA